MARKEAGLAVDLTQDFPTRSRAMAERRRLKDLAAAGLVDTGSPKDDDPRQVQRKEERREAARKRVAEKRRRVKDAPREVQDLARQRQRAAESAYRQK